MAEAFDPYHKWLAIPPEDQPADHYRLLGVKQFEADPDVIESAADQRMAHLRNFQTGKHAQHSQRLLNEVAAARVCLLNAEQRAAYDETLKGQLAQQPVVVPVGQVVAPVAVVAEPDSGSVDIGAINTAPLTPAPSTISSPHRSHKRPMPVWVLAAVAGTAALVLCLFVIVVLSVSTTATKVFDSPDVSQAIPNESDADTDSISTTQDHQTNSTTDNAGDELNTGGTDSGSHRTEKVEVVEDEQRARVIVTDRLVEVPFNHAKAPDYLRGGITWKLKKPGPSPDGARLEFDVVQAGLVYLVTSTQKEGALTGDWMKERTTAKELIANGWENMGPCPWKTGETMLRRRVRTGESYAVRTNKYSPPMLILPSRTVAQSTLAALGLRQDCVALLTFEPDTFKVEAGEQGPIDALGGTVTSSRNGCQFVEGKVGRGLSFDGKRDYLGTSLKQSQTTTFSVWIKVFDTGDFAQIFSGGSNGLGFGINLPADTKCPSVVVGNGTEYKGFRFQTPLPRDKWQHVAFVLNWEAESARFYLNGLRQPALSVIQPVSLEQCRLVISTMFEGHAFYGEMDELAIFDRALNDTEIFNVYEVGAEGKSLAD